MKIKLRKLETTLIFLAKIVLYGLLFFVFYGTYAKENWQLLNLSRTSGITIFVYCVMMYMFSNIYGRFDVGKRKSKPIVHSLLLAVVFTDIVSMLALSVMNTNENNNAHFQL